MPADTSDPTVITDYALERVRRLIGAYAETLDRTRDADELSHRLLLKILRQQVATRPSSRPEQQADPGEPRGGSDRSQAVPAMPDLESGGFRYRERACR